MNDDKPQDRKRHLRAGARIERLRNSAVAAWTGPFVVFMLLLPIPKLDLFFPVNSELPWWWSAPEHWLFPLQSLLCLALLWFWRRHYQFRPAAGLGLGAAMGFLGIAIWLIPAAWHARTGAGDEIAWLSWLGFESRLEGFDPTRFDPQSNPLGFFLTTGFRLLRLVIVVPLVEEIFWRGFLMRWLIDSKKPWHELPIGTFSWKSFLVTTILFTLVHQPSDYAAALVFGALAGWVTVRTRSLGAVILMHAVANLILGIYVMKTGFWGLW